MRRNAFVLALAFACVPSAWAVYGPSTGIGSSDSTFTWVGTVNGASGVVIAPNWVITAQHVGGTLFTLGTTTYTADATYNSPNYDLHLMHFSTTFGGYYNLFGGSILGQTVDLVGFGQAGAPRGDGTGYVNVGGGGTRRAADNTVGAKMVINDGSDPWNTPCIVCDLDHPVGSNPPAPYNRDLLGDGGPTANEGGLLGGDSGGGWFVNVGGTWQLAGVSNYILTASDAPTNDPDPALGFGISASSAADLTDPGVRAWVVNTVPEPVSTSALLVGLAGLFASRRKAKK